MEQQVLERFHRGNYARLYWHRKRAEGSVDDAPEFIEHWLRIAKANAFFIQHRDSLAPFMQEHYFWSKVVALHSSNYIEETGLPLKETHDILWDIRKQQYGSPFEKTLDDQGKRDVVLHATAFRFLCEENCGKPLTLALILRTHEILMEGAIREDGHLVNAGQLRKGEILIGRSGRGTSPEHLPRLMNDLVSKYNELLQECRSDPFALASWLKHVFVHLHPFDDGNGRLSRLLLNWSLLSQGLPFPISLLQGLSLRKSRTNYLRCVAASPPVGCIELSVKRVPALMNSLVLEAINAHWCSFFEKIRFNHLPDLALRISSPSPQRYRPPPWCSPKAFGHKRPEEIKEDIKRFQALMATKNELQKAIKQYAVKRAVSLITFSPRPISSPYTKQELVDVLGPLVSSNDPIDAGYLLSILHNKLEPNGDRTAEEILRSALAYRYVCLVGKTKPLSIEFIKKANAILCPDTKGEYRKEAAFIGTHLFPSPEVIEDAMQRLVKTFVEIQRQGELDIYHQAAWLAYEILAVRPFGDGNGRLSRLFLSWVLFSSSEIPFPVILDDDTHGKGCYRHLSKAILCARLAGGVPSVLATRLLLSIHRGYEALLVGCE